MTTLAKVGGILGGGVLISSMIISGGTENTNNMPISAPVVTEQAKALQMPVEGNFEAKKGTVSTDSKSPNSI
jgi:hypothetical protein